MKTYLGRLDLNDAGMPVISSAGLFIIESGDYLIIWPRQGGPSSVVFDAVVELVNGVPLGVDGDVWADWVYDGYEAQLEKRSHVRLVVNNNSGSDSR